MVKKTLLSLAVATALTSMVGCNVSTTDKYDTKISNSGVKYTQTSSVYPVFAPEAGQVPLAIDFLFADAADSDGTANTDDTTPPVTTALNKLDGFSTVAPHYIEFSEALDPETVQAGVSVFLIKLLNAEDDPSVDALDINTILAANPANPFSPTPITPASYEARYIGLDDGRTPAIQVLLKEPLEPKTKYLVVLTDAIKGANGDAIGQAATYAHAIGNDKIMTPDLDPVRGALKGWQQLAQGFLASGTPLAANAKGNVVFNYAFTTGGTTDVLNAMAAPGTFSTLQKGVNEAITSIEVGEGAITQAVMAEAMAQGVPESMAAQIAEAQLDDIAELVAIAIDQQMPGVLPTTDGATVRPILKSQEALQPHYLTGLVQAATKGKGDAVAAEIDAPKERLYVAIQAAPGQAVSVPYDAFFEAQVKPLVVAGVEALITDIEVGEGAITQAVMAEAMAQGASEPVAAQMAEAQLDGIAELVAIAIDQQMPGALPTTDGATVRPILKSQEGLQSYYLDGLQQAAITSKLNEQIAELSSHGAIYQGGLKVPNYLADAEVDKEDAELGTWTASDAAAQALGYPGAPRDVDGSTNVTYRFPFANKEGDNVLPVMAVLPDAASCGGTPADGWPVAIYQHGITVDRTAGVLVGNALAKACVAMVAIDHTMHGVAPGNATGILFSTEQVSKDYDPTIPETAAFSPFALARAGAAMQGDAFMAELKERHNNVGKNAYQQNVAMEFAAAGADADVGASGDLYINLSNFARTRDGMRQTVMDMLNLSASIGAMDIDADGTPDFDADNVYFVGHSLGGIVGATFVAVNNDPTVRAFNGELAEVKAAILGNPGGGVVKLLENSPAIGAAKILPGLEAAAGLTQGSTNIEKFFGVMQAMVDSADPINFAATPGLQNTPILHYTAVGDLVVPNNAVDNVTADTAKSYLAGTEPLSNLLGLKVVNAGSIEGGTGFVEGARLDVYTKDATRDETGQIISGSDHSTFSNAQPQDTFKEIYTQIGSFIQSGLTGILVTDDSVLEDAE